MADFTGQNIQDTYQRVVQVDGGQLEDGTGSALPIKFIGDDVIVPGALRANSYIVSESITIVTSGSTEFGNSSDDTHTFIGNITASKVTPVDMSDYSGSILTVGKLIAKDTDQGASIALFDADGNSIASLARMGTGANAHRGRLVLRDNANIKLQLTNNLG